MIARTWMTARIERGVQAAMGCDNARAAHQTVIWLTVQPHIFRFRAAVQHGKGA